MDDDDDENTYAHEAGRNFSIPHQKNNPLFTGKHSFHKRDSHYSLIPLPFFFWGGRGRKLRSLQRSFPPQKCPEDAQKSPGFAEAHAQHPNALSTGPFNPASAGPKNCTVNSYQHIIMWQLIRTDFPALLLLKSGLITYYDPIFYCCSKSSVLLWT